MKLIYSAQLPISSHKDKIVEEIVKNSVVVVVGETGSGKSTQIPKMILEALAVQDNTDPEFANFKIACTQPRRLAATSIANWIAEESGVELGKEVGYKIRFDDETFKGTLITVCTDGILLQEMKGDSLLSDYDAIMVDEAHERNLNIDFLLGLLKDIQEKRLEKGLRPLKLLITSATFDAEKFALFFEDLNHGKKVPIVNVSGRMFPVEIIHREVPHDLTYFRKVADEVKKICTTTASGDILIFMPGEAEIFSTIKAVEMLQLPRVQCLPLYSRLTMEEQQLIFKDHVGKRNVIVATNIAETSLTVPGIKFVIDTGLARITDFNYRTGIGSLEVKPVSQASAIQRAGRAGRIEAGTAIRLYSEEDFLEREKYTKPEIQRSDLASVLLHMILIGIKNIYAFQFIDPPNQRAFQEAYKTLHELGALKEDNTLTELGMKMAHLPLEPRISAMLLAAEKYDCVRQVAIIASSLSVKDPFLRPNGEEDLADQAKRYFQRLAQGGSGRNYKWQKIRRGRKIIRKKVYLDDSDESFLSDLMVFLVVWNTVMGIFTTEGKQQYCQENYLNFKVIEEIEQIYFQLLDTLKIFAGEEFNKYLGENARDDLQVDISESEGILKSIASGLIQNLCEGGGKQTYRSRSAENIFVHPGSILFNRHPKWFVSAEIVETTKLYARNNTVVDPTWFEEIAPHLCDYKYGNIYFDKSLGKVVREEEVFFKGHRIVRGKLVEVKQKDRYLAFEYFVREGLVKKTLQRYFGFLMSNDQVVEDLKQYASKSGNQKLILDGKRLMDWYVLQFSKAKLQPTSKEELIEIINKKGEGFLKMKLEDFLKKSELERLDKLYPEQVFINGKPFEVRYFADHYKYPTGPVISLRTQDLIDLDNDKVARLVPGNPHFKPYFLVSNGEPFVSPTAEGTDIEEIKIEYDQWHLKKSWKKVKHDQEKTGIMPAEVFIYAKHLLEKVEIGMSLFFGKGQNAIIYGYIGMQMDGKKVSVRVYEDFARALKMTMLTLRTVFKVLAKTNFYFKESDLLRLEQKYEKYFHGLEIKDRLEELLWREINLEKSVPDLKLLNDGNWLRKMMESKLAELEKNKEKVVKNWEKLLDQVQKLQDLNNGKLDPEEMEDLKEQIEKS
ncbi:MAG: ATP-dependent RNA helicase [Candidatus Altimarinota bacterium]